jgi:hypothetical protein
VEVEVEEMVKKDGSVTSWLDPMVPCPNMVGAGEVPGRRILSMGPGHSYADFNWIMANSLSYSTLQCSWYCSPAVQDRDTGQDMEVMMRDSPAYRSR